MLLAESGEPLRQLVLTANVNDERSWGRRRDGAKARRLDPADSESRGAERLLEARVGAEHCHLNQGITSI
jgi:hypothetical protein